MKYHFQNTWWFLFLFFQNSQSEDDVWIPFEYDATGFNPGLFLENYFKLLSNDSEFCFQRPKRKSCFKIHNPGIKYYFEGDKLGRTSVLDMLPKLSTALGLSNRISNTMVKPITKRILEYEEDYSDSNSSANKKARHSVIKEEETWILNLKLKIFKFYILKNGRNLIGLYLISILISSY